MPETSCVPDDSGGLRGANARLRELLAERDERLAERDDEQRVSIEAARAENLSSYFDIAVGINRLVYKRAAEFIGYRPGGVIEPSIGHFVNGNSRLCSRVGGLDAKHDVVMFIAQDGMQRGVLGPHDMNGLCQAIRIRGTRDTVDTAKIISSAHTSTASIELMPRESGLAAPSFAFPVIRATVASTC